MLIFLFLLIDAARGPFMGGRGGRGAGGGRGFRSGENANSRPNHKDPTPRNTTNSGAPTSNNSRPNHKAPPPQKNVVSGGRGGGRGQQSN